MDHKFSANSKSLRNFRLYQRLAIIPVVIILIIGLAIVVWVQRSYHDVVNPPEESNQIPTNQDGTTRQRDESGNRIDDPFENSPNPPGSHDQIDQGGLTPPVSAGQTQPSSPAPTAPSSNIPAQVSTILDSLERNGIKNNPYVSTDTSNVPDGTTLSINRGSWSQRGDSGSVGGTVTVYGQSTPGTLYFQKVDGSWKIVDYSLG